ncbi:putative cytochrome P450 6a23 isoform X2 [Lycorma delicatula]
MGVIFEDFWIEAVLGIIGLFIGFYHFWTLNYNYWKERNIAYIPPVFPFGNTKDATLSTRFTGYVFRDLYFQLKGHKFGGITTLRKPQLLLRDPEIIKLILTKDFNHFTDRGLSPVDEEHEPLSAHLFNLQGEKWKILRTKLTPTFTSGKMKIMFHLMKACAEKLEKGILKHAEKEDVVEIKDYMARFSTDVIGSCAFGLDIDSINNPDNVFRKISKEIFKPSLSLIIRNALNAIVPGLSTVLRVKITPKEREDFFFKVVHDTVEYREKNNVKRNDFLDLLIQLRKGQLELDDEHEKSNFHIHGNETHKKEDTGKLTHHNPSNDIEMTNRLMTAQCFVFFLAGFETSSTTLSFCLYELALNKEIQTKLQVEIDKVLAKHNGEISYESIKEMTYMDTVVQETLRMYPPASVLSRDCVSDYKLPESDLEIKKGIHIMISLLGIHYDPEYYPHPYQFNPDRFTEEAKQSRHHYTWLPFGEGPRICIGMRFGLLQIKMGLATLLSKYNFDQTAETQVPMEFSSKSLVTSPKYGIKLKISKR